MEVPAVDVEVPDSFGQDWGRYRWAETVLAKQVTEPFTISGKAGKPGDYAVYHEADKKLELQKAEDFLGSYVPV